MNFLGLGQSAEIEIVFDGAENRKTVDVKGEDGKVEKMLLYYDGETVSGKVNVTLKKPGSKLEHQGIKIEFIGQIELFYDRGNHHEFKCLAKALARPGDLNQNHSYPFDFPNVEKQFEVYAGSNVRLRYFLRATIVRRISDIIREIDIAVHTLCSYPELNNPIKMEVGIEDCLHIEFEYNKSKYHLKDTIIGKIYFLLVRIKIKHMEIAIIKRESTGTGPNMFTENETIAKYEIMDGAPVKGESIPIRVFLAGYNLTPTMRDINKKFSVKYFLNLVLMDTEDRRYFKQQEITLWRKADIPRYHAPTQQQQQQQITAKHSHQHIQHQQVPQHAPQHLVSGPAAPTVAPSLLQHANTTTTTSSSSSSNNNNNTNNDTEYKQHVISTESKMGLFTRESPNQEFSQHIDSPLPSSPLTPNATLPSDTDVTTTTTAAVAAATTTTTQTAKPIERGIGDGAAATNTSPVMLFNTPPPLPRTVENLSGTQIAANIDDDDDDVDVDLAPKQEKQKHIDFLSNENDDINQNEQHINKIASKVLDKQKINENDLTEVALPPPVVTATETTKRQTTVATPLSTD